MIRLLSIALRNWRAIQKLVRKIQSRRSWPHIYQGTASKGTYARKRSNDYFLLFNFDFSVQQSEGCVLEWKKFCSVIFLLLLLLINDDKSRNERKDLTLINSCEYDGFYTSMLFSWRKAKIKALSKSSRYHGTLKKYRIDSTGWRHPSAR